MADEELGNEMFYTEDGVARDAQIQNPILKSDMGDLTCQVQSRDRGREMGMDEDTLKQLYPRAYSGN